MLEGLALSLVKTLATFLFDKYLRSTEQVKVDGAPSWYYTQEDRKVCTYTFIDGDYRYIDYAKQLNRKAMEKEIQSITEKTIYENMSYVKGERELSIVNNFRKDRELPTFVKAKIEYPKISYENEVNRVFVKGCIDKEVIYNYEKRKLQAITKSISLYHSNSAFDEMDEKYHGNSLFEELEEGF